MTEQILFIIIAVLGGIIIGGSGGAAIIRRTLKIPANGNGDNTIAVAAAAAATAASAAFRSELNQHMNTFEKQLDENTKRLTSLESAISGFESGCKERHKGVDWRLNKLEGARE